MQLLSNLDQMYGLGRKNLLRFFLPYNCQKSSLILPYFGASVSVF